MNCMGRHETNGDLYAACQCGVAQWQNIGLWPANFPCPALDLQLMSDQ